MGGAGVGRRSVLGMLSACGATAATGCLFRFRSTSIESPEERDASLVFGYLDMSQAPTGIDWMFVRQLEPPAEERLEFKYAGGAFFHDDVGPGLYVLDEFGSEGSIFSSPTTYGGGRQESPVRIEVKQPGVHFVGSFAFVEIEGEGMLSRDGFQIVEAKTPSEAEVIRSILENAEGSSWEAPLRARLAELS